MTFSATSLTEARSADGGRSRGSVPLMGLDVTRVAGAAQEQFRRQRGHRAPVARDERRPGGCGAGDGVGEEVDRVPVQRADELGAHAGLVHLARGDGLEAGQHSRAVDVAVGCGPVDGPRRGRAG